MRKALTLTIVLTLCFTMIGCGNNASSKNPDQLNDTEIEEIEIVKDNEEEGSVEINKKLINVEVTLPMSFLGLDDEELDIDQVVKDAKEQGIKDVIVNDNESITYIMSKSKHTEMMEEMKENITETMDDLVSGEDFTSFQEIVANKDFTEFEVVVIKDQFENGFEGFGTLGLAINSLFYQLFDGANPDNYRTVINMRDEATGEIFNTIVYPDAFNE